MENDYKILNQITPEIKNPYQLVDGYFNGFADGVFLKIAAKKSIYQLPEGYFETLASQILIRVKIDENEISEELEEIAPLLNSIKKENIYKIPNDYFIGSTNKLAPQESKLVVMRKPSLKWLKYTVAAVFVGVLAINGLKLYKEDGNKIDIQASIQNLPETELIKGIESEKTSLVSTDDVVSSLLDLSNLQDEIQFVSDEEIEVYLKENNVSTENPNSPNS